MSDLLLPVVFTIVFSGSIVAFISAMSGQCPLNIGDSVVNVETKETGTVRSISGIGGWTMNCRVSVSYPDYNRFDEDIHNGMLEKR